MDYAGCLQMMEANAERIRALAEGIGDAQARWKPDPDAWSILETVGHLLDEERGDFWMRLDLILHQPETPWPDLVPRAAIVEQAYNARDLGVTLEAFLTARGEALAWLRELEVDDWGALCAPGAGLAIPAGAMFASWVAHDWLHIRQLVELHYAYVERVLAAPFKVDYAGGW